MQIAIDGPSGAGKSSIAKAVAAALGIVYVDTGALYRTVGYYVRSQGIAREDREGILRCLPAIRIEVRYENGAQHVYLNGEDLGDKIREPEISMYASAVSAHPGVRVFLLEMQRELARKNNVIMDGRDIGTVVMPEAEIKVFLTAAAEERARRRCRELEQRGTPEPFEKVLADIEKRDWDDSHRATAPLKQAEDAVLLDTTELDFAQSEAALLEIIREKTAL